MRERPQLFGTRAHTHSHAHVHRPCANSSKVTRLKKTHTFSRKVAERFICCVATGSTCQRLLDGQEFPAGENKLHRLITEREPNFSAYYLFFRSFFFLETGASETSSTDGWNDDWSTECLSHQTRLGIAQTEPETVTAWITAPSWTEHAS